MTTTKQGSLRQRISSWLARLAGVTAVLPGRTGDGLAPLGQDLFGLLDKSWGEQFQELLDARTAWRQNPLARRLVGMVTAYVVGNGVTVSSPRRDLNRFAHAWWTANAMDSAAGGLVRRIEPQRGAVCAAVPPPADGAAGGAGAPGDGD